METKLFHMDRPYSYTHEHDKANSWFLKLSKYV